MNVFDGFLIAVVAFAFLNPDAASLPQSDSVAQQFVKQYCLNLGDGELDHFADKLEASDAPSSTLAKEFAEITTKKRQAASKATVDKSIVEMLDAGTDHKQVAELIRQSSATWKRIGEAL